MFIDLNNKFQDKQKSWNFIGKKVRENRNKKFWSEPPADSDFKKNPNFSINSIRVLYKLYIFVS